MRVFILTFLSVFLVCIGGVAMAAECYSPAQAEADQGIRIHSELMVIGLNCQQIGARYGLNLYGQYREFTARHADLFGGYEDILLAFFKKRGDGKPEASLNTLRTKYANKISNDAAGMRPDIFCATYAPRVEAAHKMSREDLKKWAATIYPSHPVSYPLCEG
ncbi:MAG: hypothetical protein KDJ35_00655 [Alphaproteobacteria bacterium]|nr:hypothetical protein [Alphaproteobacteria bacterium]